MKTKVLLVEDNQQNAYLINYLLEALGLVVVTVANGREALERVRLESPDLIITDIQLPELDGYELGLALKADPELRTIPLIAATSYAMPGDRQKALAIGFDAYFEKPIDPEDFTNSIRSFIRERDLHCDESSGS